MQKNKKGELSSETLIMILLLVIGIFILIMLTWKYIANPLKDVNADNAMQAITKECKVGEQNCASLSIPIRLTGEAISFLAHNSIL